MPAAAAPAVLRGGSGAAVGGEDRRHGRRPVSAHFGVWEREEVRGLLAISETSGPPTEHQPWYWGQARLFIIAHQGWAAAVRDALTFDMERLGIQLLLEIARPPSPPHRGIAGPAGWRRRPSRPSGLRAPPRGASAAPALKRKD